MLCCIAHALCVQASPQAFSPRSSPGATHKTSLAGVREVLIGILNNNSSNPPTVLESSKQASTTQDCVETTRARRLGVGGAKRRPRVDELLIPSRACAQARAAKNDAIYGTEAENLRKPPFAPFRLALSILFLRRCEGHDWGRAGGTSMRRHVIRFYSAHFSRLLGWHAPYNTSAPNFSEKLRSLIQINFGYVLRRSAWNAASD